MSKTTRIIGHKNGEVFVTRRAGHWKQDSVKALAGRLGLTGKIKAQHINTFGSKPDDWKIVESFTFFKEI